MHRENPGRPVRRGLFWVYGSCIVLFVRAEVKGINVSAVLGEVFLQRFVYGINVRFRVKAPRNTTLIADYNDGASRLIQRHNGLFDSGKEVKEFPVANIFPFGYFEIDDPVTIEKDIFDEQCLGSGLRRR